MSDRIKTVLVIEDERVQREVISKTLACYGFNPVAGETIARTLELLDEHKNDAAVIVVDMMMDEFPDYVEQCEREAATISGTWLARRLLRSGPARRPEIIILSAYGDRIDYYKQAIEAGASAYLQKGTEEARRRFVPLVQALALKNSFQPSAAGEAEIAALAEGHANSFELLDYFCRNKLSGVLDSCLGWSSYMLLLSDGSGYGAGAYVSSYTSVGGVPGAEEFDYAGLHRAVFEQVSRHAAHTLAVGGFERLKDFTFIQLVNASGVEIAVGIPDPFPVKDVVGEFPFSTASLAEALIEHASPAVETFVEKLLFRWREKRAVKIERVRALAGLCGAVQRRLGALINEAPPAARHEGLERLSRELADYDRTLSRVLEGAAGADPGAEGETRLSDVVQEIRAEYDRLGHSGDISFVVEADCLIPAEPYFFSLALRELVRWAARRRGDVAGGARQVVRVGCAAQGNWTEVHFRDESARLSRHVRQSYLFEPLSPLHLAQIMIEVACHGSLTDATDESQAAEGHLFKMLLLRK